MANSAKTLEHFSFSDGQYLPHFSEGHICVMEYLNWQERLFRFVFSGVAMVRSYCGTSSLCEARVRTDSELIDDCRRVLTDDWGSSGGPKDVALMELTITDDVPLFTVVFTDVEIVVPLDSSDRIGVPR